MFDVVIIYLSIATSFLNCTVKKNLGAYTISILQRWGCRPHGC